MGGSDLQDELALQERAWAENSVLRSLYRSWYAAIADRLAAVPGPTVELGSGIGRLRETLPNAVLTDVEQTPWSDLVVDAEKLPFEDGSLANIVLLDVLHHVPQPAAFLDEARRCLPPRGRVVMIEPYCSPLSTFVFRRWHHELTDLRVDPLDRAPRSSREPLDSNQALPTLLFFREASRFRARWPDFEIVERRRFAFLAYPLSGGWRRRRLLAPSLLRPTLALERVLDPVAPALAFRCLVVLERRQRSAGV